MKKLLKKLFILSMVVALFGIFTAPAAHAGYIHFTITVYKDTGYATSAGGYTQLTSGVQYIVLEDTADSLETIYSDTAGTAMTNPVTATVFNTTDDIDFYVSDAETAVDIIVVDNSGGYTAILDNCTTSTHTCIIDETPGVQHKNIIWYCMYSSGATPRANALDGNIDTEVDLLDGMIVHDVQIEVVQASAGSSIGLCVGGGSTGEGDIDGFVGPQDVDVGVGRIVATKNRAIRTAVACPYYGAFFTHEVGDNAAAFCDGTEDVSIYWEGPAFPYQVNGAHCLSYRISSSDSTANTAQWFSSSVGWGFIHYWVSKLR